MPRRTLAEHCADRLRSAILEGSLSVGERLPAEQELADRLEVSRLTLRSALIRLAGEGLVEARHGSGYTVRDFRRSAGSALLPEVVQLARELGSELDVVADLLRVRRHLAGALLERMQEHPPSPGEVDEVEAAVQRFADLVAADAGPDAIAQADSEILAALLVASGSLVLQLTLHPVREVLRVSPHLCRAMYADPRTNLVGWEVLVGWLRAPMGSTGPLLELLAARDAETLAAFARLGEPA